MQEGGRGASARVLACKGRLLYGTWIYLLES